MDGWIVSFFLTRLRMHDGARQMSLTEGTKRIRENFTCLLECAMLCETPAPFPMHINGFMMVNVFDLIIVEYSDYICM